MVIKGTERNGKQWNQKTDYKLLVWVSPLSFISNWLLKERNGTESNGTKRLSYKQLTCLSISFISKWLLKERNGSEWNGTERKAIVNSTCFYPYLPPSLSLFLGFPFHSVPLRFVIPDNDIEILSNFLTQSPFRSAPFRHPRVSWSFRVFSRVQ